MFIMGTFFLVLQIQCPNTQKINESNEPWNQTDRDAFNRATRVCATDNRYTDTPCLKLFIKREPMAYAALCSEPLKRVW